MTPILRRALRASSGAALLLLLVFSACAGNPLRPRTAPSPDEVAALQQRILELQRKVTVNEVEMARLRERLAALEGGRPAPAAARDSASSNPGTSRFDTEPPAHAGAPSNRATPPSSRVEVIEADDLDPEPVPTPYRRPPDPPIVRPVEPAPPAAATVDPAPAIGGGEASAGTAVPPAGQALYDQGYAFYHQGRYVDAESSFQRFLQAYPGTDLADNALFWIGQARLSRGDVRGALAAFRETVDRFPGGNKLPDALLKAGQCLEQLGDLGGARDSYDELIRRFPGSAASAVAEEQRAALP